MWLPVWALLVPCACWAAGNRTLAPEALQRARLYGHFKIFAYWFVDLAVGTPAQRVSVIVDTASSLLAFPCQPCSQCGAHLDPNFAVEASRSASWVPCGEACSGTCSKGACSYSLSFLEGSSFAGRFFEDSLQLGDTADGNAPFRGRMGCHDSETHLFYTQSANGIFGLAPHGGASVFNTLLGDARVFALCLSQHGGGLTMGGYTEDEHTGPIAWIPLLQKAKYLVSADGFWAHGERIAPAASLGDTMIDSGTTFTFMKTALFKGLKQVIVDGCDPERCGTFSNPCFALHSAEALDRFPVISMRFDGGRVAVDWRAKDYLWSKRELLWCLSIADDGPHRGTTLGSSWMQHKHVVFDLGNSRVGVAEAECESHSSRPEHGKGYGENDEPTEELGRLRVEELNSWSAVWRILLLCVSIVALVSSLCWLACRHRVRGKALDASYLSVAQRYGKDHISV